VPLAVKLLPFYENPQVMKYKPLMLKLFLRPLFVMLLVVATTTVSGQQVLKLDLRAAVDTALLHNNKIKQYQQVVQQKNYLNKAAVGNFLPSIDLAGGYTYMSQNPEINMDQVKGSIDDIAGKYGAGIASQLGLSPEVQQQVYQTVVDAASQVPAYNVVIDQQQYPSLNVVALQPIFLGGKIIAGKRFAEAELEYANQDLVQVSNEIIRETIERYYGVVLLNQVIITRKEVLAGMKKHEQQAIRAIEIGVIPAHEVLRAQVAVANAERDLADDENKLELAKMALKTSMGLDQSFQIEATDKFEYKMHPVELANLESEARLNQPIFKMIEQKKVMVDQQHALDISEFLPQVVAYGEYSWFREEYPVIMPPYIVGVQAKVNLFHGLKKYNNLKATQFLSKEVEAARQYANGQVELWVNKSYREVLNKEERYVKMKPTVELAAKNLEINEKRFQEGLSKSIDVIDARLLYEGMVVERLKSLYDYYIALSDLYLATGNPDKVVTLLNN
jgi:outer membrane protein TolC